MTKAKVDVYQTITDQLIEALEAGVKPWVNSWKGSPAGGLPLRHNGEPYQGINVLVLWCAALSKGYASPNWMTFRQAKELGGAVRKGEKSTTVMYYGSATKDDADTGEEKRFSFAKSYRVFNAEQIDGLADHYTTPHPTIDTGARPVDEWASYFERVGANVQTRQGTPCYVPATDIIYMPPICEFESAEAFFSVLAHEHAHWTGRVSRCDRPLEQERQKYSYEEIIAEIGAAMVAANVGFVPDIENSAAYLASWLAALKNDKRFIISAASKAQAAANYIHQRAQVTPQEEAA